MNFSRVKIVTTAPLNDADKIRKALGEAGAGKIGEYSFCSTSILSKGRFKPSDKAHPFIGKANKLEVVEEEIIEVICERVNTKQVVAALRAVHPYEEPVIDIIPLLDEEDL